MTILVLNQVISHSESVYVKTNIKTQSFPAVFQLRAWNISWIISSSFCIILSSTKHSWWITRPILTDGSALLLPLFLADRPQRMNNILTSATEPYDVSLSRSFQNLSHLQPSYELPLKPDLSKYSLHRLSKVLLHLSSIAVWNQRPGMTSPSYPVLWRGSTFTACTLMKHLQWPSQRQYLW